MKKSILVIALAATMAAPAAMAAPTVYGNIHLALNQADNDVPGADNNLKVSSNASYLGVKGSEDLGDGLKAIYKLEFGVTIGDKADTTPDTGFLNGSEAAVGGLTGRDQFIGLKSGMGTIKFGTMASNYKQMGGKLDPLYHTPLEARGFLKTQSNLHGGRAINRGRQTHTAQYTSPKMSGAYLVANTTFSGSEDETSGIGVRWSNKSILAYVDWINGQTGAARQNCDAVDAVAYTAPDPAVAGDNGTAAAAAIPACKSESAVKVGGKYTAKAFAVGLQYEAAEDRTGADYIFASGQYNINKNNSVILTYGIASAKAANADTSGVAVAYKHTLSKLTHVYAGYGAKSSDVNNEDEAMLSLGIRKKF